MQLMHRTEACALPVASHRGGCDLTQCNSNRQRGGPALIGLALCPLDVDSRLSLGWSCGRMWTLWACGPRSMPSVHAARYCCTCWMSACLCTCCARSG